MKPSERPSEIIRRRINEISQIETDGKCDVQDVFVECLCDYLDEQWEKSNDGTRQC